MNDEKDYLINLTTTNNDSDETIIDLYPDPETKKIIEDKLKEVQEKINNGNQNELFEVNNEINDNNANNNIAEKEKDESVPIEKETKRKKKKKKKKKKTKNNGKIIITAKEKEKETIFMRLRRFQLKPIKRGKSPSQTQNNPKYLNSQFDKKEIVKSKSEKSLHKQPIKENEESKNSSVPKLTHNIKKYKLKPVLTHYMKEIKKQETYEAHLIKIRKIFSEKKYLVPEGKFFTYVIMPGNASYLVKNCFKHRVNWREPEMKISSIFNFKWQQTNLCIDFGSLSSIEKIPQIVNHFEFHSALSNKINMFVNLFEYCEENKINIFKYVPFTILINEGVNTDNFEKFFNVINDYITPYEELVNDNLRKKKKKSMGGKIYYSDYFNLCKGESRIGENTKIMIPPTHYIGKNFWVIKASNLNRGQCIRIADSSAKALSIIKTYNQGIKLKNLPKDNENNIQVSCIQNTSSSIPQIEIYKTNKIIVQKYIERPLLYKGRKCDMRIWVLVTHDMKVYVFKEGHLKTCSANYDINNTQDAYVHITNYSFQKHAEQFQKFEIGNEVSFIEFQKFLNTEHKDKNIDVQKDIMGKVKEIVEITMKSVKNKINMNKRHFSFEIFGYDFMMDDEFNMFLIEINTNPGIEESSPWIKVIIPRMLDDALRLTIDKIFPTKYVFDKEIKELALEECLNEVGIQNKKIEIENNVVEEKKSEIVDNEVNNELKSKDYVSPFPVPGYRSNDILWDFVCDISDGKNDKKSNNIIIGIKGLLMKKKPNSN